MKIRRRRQRKVVAQPSPSIISATVSVRVSNSEIARLDKNQRKAFMVGLGEIIAFEKATMRESEAR